MNFFYFKFDEDEIIIDIFAYGNYSCLLTNKNSILIWGCNKTPILLKKLDFAYKIIFLKDWIVFLENNLKNSKFLLISKF